MTFARDRGPSSQPGASKSAPSGPRAGLHASPGNVRYPAQPASPDGLARHGNGAAAVRSRASTAPVSGPGSQGRPGPRSPMTTYRAGERIFTAGSGEGLVYIVRSGCVRLYKTLNDGRSINVGLLGPNTVFVQEDSADGLASGAIAEALVPSDLSIIAARDLASLIAAEPELCSAIVTGMSRRLTELQTLVEHLLVRDTSVRLSVTLLNLAAKFGRPCGGGLREITMPLTHQGLAQMIGSNRVTVTRKLAELNDLGAVRTLARNSLAVDVGLLRAYASPSDPSAPATGDRANGS